jgi:hypothetical protein
VFPRQLADGDAKVVAATIVIISSCKIAVVNGGDSAR